MSTRDKTEPFSLDVSTADGPRQFRERFEACWKFALRGGPRPSLESYLEQVAAPERPALRRELERIERDYQRFLPRSSDTADGTMDLTGLPRLVRLDPPATVNVASEAVDSVPSIDLPPVADSGATVDPTMNLGPADSGATVDPTMNLGPADSGATVDPTMNLGPADSGATVDPTMNLGPADAGATVDPTMNLGPRTAADSAEDLNGATVDPTMAVSSDSALRRAERAAGATAAPGAKGGSNFDFSLAGNVKKSVTTDRSVVPGYEILGELGRGGMGVVYKARQKGLNRIVALKMVLAGVHAAGEQLVRFATEAEAVARLKHPNIVQIFDVGEHNGLPYFSLEFLDGGSLSGKISGKPQPVRDAAKLTALLADAMACAHAQDIIHRDLKPANILLSQEGEPKITDFGLAKRLDDDSAQTKSGTLMGTPSYMAPEQARGDIRQVGPLSDTYSLGAILYELLTGRPPFQGTTILETLEQVRKQEPLPPTKLQPKVPRDLETICLKCLQKEPHKRYAGAAELAHDLNRYLKGEPILARRVTLPERAWRWCRRNPRVAALSGAVCVLVVTAATAFGVLAVRAAREREMEAKKQQEHEAALQTSRGQAELRLEEATAAMRLGNHQQALDLLKSSDPLLENDPDLADVRSRFEALRTQAEWYGEFRDRLDTVKFLGFAGNEQQRQVVRQERTRLLELVDELEHGTGKGRAGKPPLDAKREQYLREDLFESLLLAGLIENQLTLDADKETARRAAQLSLDWYNRAEQLLPGTKALRVQRAVIQGILGDQAAAERDLAESKTIEATSSVERFWHGYAEHRRALKATAARDTQGRVRHFRGAMDEYAAILATRPDHFWAYMEWATCQLELEDLTNAQIGISKCIQLRPEFAGTYFSRGEILWVRGQRAANSGNHAAALDRYHSAFDDDSMVIKLRKDWPQGYEKRAIVSLAGLKDFATALDDWRQLASLQPHNAGAHYYQAVVLIGQRKYDDALPEVEQALKLNPRFIDAHWARAQIFLWQGKPRGALAAIDPVCEKLPADKADTLNVRGDIYRAMGQFDKAVADHRKVIELMPRYKESYYSLALDFLKQGRTADAAAVYEQLVAADPASPEVYLKRAEFLRDRGEFDAALADCDRAVQKGDKTSLPELVRASIAAARGKGDEAVAVAEPLAAAIPNDNGPMLYTAACVWSLASRETAKAGTTEARDRAQHYAERAAELLRRALNKGYHEFQYETHNRMIDDPALAPIHALPGIRALLEHQPLGAAS